MTTTNTGNQAITFDYEQSLNATDLSKRFEHIMGVGIYQGGNPSIISVTEVDISPCVVEISDGDEQVRIESTTTVTVEPTETNPYMILEWSRGNQDEWYGEFKVVSGYNNTDIVFAKATFAAGDITGIDLSERSYPTANYRAKFSEGIDIKSDIYKRIKTVTSDAYTAVDKDYYIGVDYSGVSTITLPAVDEGREIVVKDESGNASAPGEYITIDTAGTDNIDGSSTYTIDTDYGKARLIYNGSNWSVV